MERIMRQDSNLSPYDGFRIGEIGRVLNQIGLNQRRHHIIYKVSSGKLMFDIHPKIAYNLADQDFSRVLTLHQDFKRKDLMKEGNRPYSITYRIAYALSNTHHSDLFLRKEYIDIPRIFKEFAKVMTQDPIKIPRIGGVDLVIKDHPVLERTISTRTEFSSRMSFSEDRIVGYREKEKELIKIFTPQEIRVDNVKLRCPGGWKEIQVVFDITKRDNHFPCDDLYYLQQPVIGRYRGMLEIAGHEILVAGVAEKENGSMTLGLNFLEDHKSCGRKAYIDSESGICTAKPGVFPKEAMETLPVVAGRNFSQKILILNKGNRDSLKVIASTRNSLENVKRLIQRNFSENPLAWWDRNKIEATLKVKEECKYEYVRYKPIQMNMNDKKDMQGIIKEYINLGLIEPGVSAYSSPGFLVRNHGEIKRGIFIKDLAKYRKDFRPFLKETESSKWKWEEIHTQRVRELKQVCSNLPKLVIPQDEDELVVYTDANDYRWAAVLMKKTTTGEEPCRYTGGLFSEQQAQVWHINEKEFFAVWKAFKKWPLFLLAKEFTLKVDNTNVKAFLKNKLESKIEKAQMEGFEANSVMLRLRHLRENLEELDREFGRLTVNAQVAEQVQRADLDIVQTTIRSSLVASTALWNALQESIRKASPSVRTRELREHDPKHALRVQGSRPVAANSSTVAQGHRQTLVYQRMWEKLISRKGINPSKTIVETSKKYNRVWMLQGSKPEDVREWYDFGALASVHTISPSFLKISKLPEWISGAVYDSWQNNPQLKRGDILELKFISAAPETAGKGSHPAFYFIKLQRPDMVAFNKIKTATEEAPLVSAISEDDISTRRAWGLWVCLTEMDKVKYPFKIFSNKLNKSFLLNSMTGKSTEFAESMFEKKRMLIWENKLSATEVTRMKTCNMLHVGQ
ncbi:UNVERIFIED_CONTAM: movement protein [Sesamum latifolium]|uniref:Movement protein n=1 Tax=Sesamum latifolium TaxID=2727402 RepID=A0AAW2VYJ1_9LAMI